nr:hypothetical protein [Macronycteris gammaherpesvirus 1]
MRGFPKKRYRAYLCFHGFFPLLLHCMSFVFISRRLPFKKERELRHQCARNLTSVVSSCQTNQSYDWMGVQRPHLIGLSTECEALIGHICGGPTINQSEGSIW